VDVSSPDRSVRLLVDRDGQLAVTVQEVNRHTEASLAGQVRAAARVALASLQTRDDAPAADGWSDGR
jgi:hypothetical protein